MFHRARLISLLLSALLLWAAPAQSTPTVEDYAALPTASLMSISPDGELIAFRKKTDEQDVVVVVSLKDGEMVQGVDTSEIDIINLYFFDESKLIIQAAENRRLLGYRGSHDISTAFVFDVKSGDLNQLLRPGDNIYKGQTGLGGVVGVSKDNKHVFMPARVADSDTDRSPDLSLMKVDLASPRSPSVAVKGRTASEDFFVDSYGNVVAEERLHNRANYHAIVAYHGDEAVEIFRQETELPEIKPVGVTPDGSALVISKEDESLGWTTLRTMTLLDGEVSKPVVARDDADVHKTISDINRTVYGVIYAGLRPEYEFFNSKPDERMAEIVAAYPGHSVWLVDWTPDWAHMVVKVTGPNSAGDYILHSEDGGSRFLTSARPAIEPEHIHPISEISYKARDGLTIPALLTLPSDRLDSLENLPAVVLPHGGPESHDWVGFNWIAQALANRGYLVIQPQFRGSSGFGVEHSEAGKGEWGKKMQDDLTDGVHALAKEGLIDPDRTCIMGWSYGGYAALAGGAFTPEVYQCVVSINGVADLEQMLDEETSDHGGEHWIVAYWKDIMSKGEADEASLQADSPANSADQFRVPVLLIHGEDDKIVPVEQSETMHKELEDADKPVELLTLADDGHGLSKAENRLEALTTAVDFIDSHIGQTPDGQGE